MDDLFIFGMILIVMHDGCDYDEEDGEKRSYFYLFLFGLMMTTWV